MRESAEREVLSQTASRGPEMMRDLGLSATQWGWVVGIFALSYALFEIP